MEMKHYPFWQMPFWGVVEGFKEAFGWTILIVKTLGRMLADLIVRGIVPKDVAGPVGIFQLTGLVAKTGVLSIIQFVGVLSVNLAIVNSLPLFALDGGKLVFIGFEALTHHRPNPSLERWVNMVGMTVLFLLFSLITLNDIFRLTGTIDFLSRLEVFWPF